MTTKAKKTVFIVDDDADYLFQMKTMIEHMGFDVITACGQKEAEDLINRITPDLYILDLMMENQDSGFILSHKIKKITPQVPVIIATAITAETGMTFSVESDDDKSWIKADKYIEKGIRPDQLHREINKLLKI
ncbi:MAG: Alginate biosynthesis transcriptional regulatory protein AlgB [Bacteroidetes bacterium ADurb.Bin408]|nr:MAG: Alginate biosynthesis transcriptional regulatory protein AlgB [Bacteroidetes bacterium ADurb.Bin408]